MKEMMFQSQALDLGRRIGECSRIAMSCNVCCRVGVGCVMSLNGLVMLDNEQSRPSSSKPVTSLGHELVAWKVLFTLQFTIVNYKEAPVAYPG